MRTAATLQHVRWTAALCVAAILATAAVLLGGAESPARILVAATQPIRSGEAWRLVTGPLVHGTWAHLGRDLVVLAAMGCVYEPVLGRRWLAVVAAGVIVPGGWVALAHPESSACYGLSGATYTMIAVAVVHEWRGSSGALRGLVTAFAIGAAFKLVWEATTGTLLMPMDIGGARPAPGAHLAGAIAGLVVGWLATSDAGRRAS